MKRNTFIYVGILLIFTGFMVFQSCAQSINNEGSSFNSKKELKKKDFNNKDSNALQYAKRSGKKAVNSKWWVWIHKLSLEEKLNAYIDGEFAQLISAQTNNNLKLLGYGKTKKITIDNAIKKTAVTGKSLVPVYKSSNEFILLEFKHSGLLLSKYNHIRKILIKKYNNMTLKMVKLHWKYKDQRFSTKSIFSVSQKSTKFVYGRIISLLSEAVE